MGRLERCYSWARKWRNGLILRAANTAWQAAVVAILAAPREEGTWALLGALAGAVLSSVKTLIVTEFSARSDT